MYVKRRLKRKKNRQLFIKNRLVILNEDTFEEIFSLKLNLMKMFYSSFGWQFYDFSPLLLHTPFTGIYSKAILLQIKGQLISFKIPDSLTLALKKNESLYFSNSKST
jgi:hypothetical protein